MPMCSALLRFAMRLSPDAAAITCSPCAPVTIASSSRHSPLTTWPRLKRGLSPSITSTFASPRSASTSRTSRPRIARATPRLTATVVLPTPPLPPVTAITLTGRARLSAASAPAWCHAESAPSVFLCIHSHLAEMSGEHGLLGHALSVGEMRDRQLVANDDGERSAEASGFVDFRQYAGLRLERGENAHGVLERRQLGVGGERQQDA